MGSQRVGHDLEMNNNKGNERQTSGKGPSALGRKMSGQPLPSPEHLPHLGTEPTSPALQADSLPAGMEGHQESPVKARALNIYGFVGHTVSVATTGLSPQSLRADLGPGWRSGWPCSNKLCSGRAAGPGLGLWSDPPCSLALVLSRRASCGCVPFFLACPSGTHPLAVETWLRSQPHFPGRVASGESQDLLDILFLSWYEVDLCSPHPQLPVHRLTHSPLVDKVNKGL